MTFEDYRKAPGTNASLVGDWLTDPLDARDTLAGKGKETPSLSAGRLIHSLVFEPRWAEANHHIRPDTYTNDKGEEKKWNANATACKEWIAEHQDKPIVSRAKFDAARAEAKVIRAHPHVKPLLVQGGKREFSMFADCPRFGRLKCRFDYINPDAGIAVDLKSMRDATDAGMAKAIAVYHYHVKAAFYIHVAKLNGIEVKEFWYIGVRFGDPLRINVKQLDPQDIMAGRMVFERVLPELQNAQLTGNGPYPSGGKITMPEWAWDKWQNEQEQLAEGLKVA